MAARNAQVVGGGSLGGPPSALEREVLRPIDEFAALRSVDGFTALSIAVDLERRTKQYRAGWWAGYLIGRATEMDEATERRAHRTRGRPR